VRPAVEFLALTGWRKSEVLGLEWRNVNASAGVIVLALTKSGEPRLLPYGRSARLKEFVQEQRAKAGSTLVTDKRQLGGSGSGAPR
jgi:integrase